MGEAGRRRDSIIYKPNYIVHKQRMIFDLFSLLKQWQVSFEILPSSPTGASGSQNHRPPGKPRKSPVGVDGHVDLATQVVGSHGERLAVPGGEWIFRSAIAIVHSHPVGGLGNFYSELSVVIPIPVGNNRLCAVHHRVKALCG